MSTPIILARSPYIIEIDQVDSIGSQVELYIWNGTGSAPVDPTYKLSKKVAKPTETRTQYDISPYIREYIKQISETPGLNISYDDKKWCNIIVKRYNTTEAGNTLLTQQLYYAFDGYHRSGIGYPLLDIQWLNGTIPFFGFNLFDSLTTNKLNSLCDFIPEFVVVNGNGWYFVWGITGSEITENYFIEGDELQNINLNPSIGFDYLRVYTPDDDLVHHYKFYEEDYCETITLYYINSKGCLAKTCLNGSFKINSESTADEYQLFQPDTYANTHTIYPEKQQFNKNAKQRFTINTNWKPQNWNVILQEIMLSEYIYIEPSIPLANELYYTSENTYFTELPQASFVPFAVKLLTNQTKMYRHAIDKAINYELEFEYLKELIYKNI